MKFRLVVFTLMLSACSSNPIEDKQVLDSSNRGESFPDWVKDNKVAWENDEVVQLKGTQTVRGDQRVNACYDFAKMDAKENLISEVQATIKGEINQVSEGTSEIDPVLLTKMIRESIEGSIRGLRTTETAFERYEIKSIERIDCFVLMSMKKSDYQKMRNTLASQMRTVNPELVNALLKRSVNFFSDSSKDGEAQ